jgi:hypothetical protein
MQRGRQPLKMTNIETDMYRGRLAGKVLGKETGRTENCQATRPLAIEDGMHRGDMYSYIGRLVGIELGT